MSINIYGSFPKPLFKGFTKKEHAEDFLGQGFFILNNLKYYRNIEDSERKDKDEGEGRVVVNMMRPVVSIDPKTREIQSTRNEPGPVYFETSSINYRYIMCFSGPKVDLEYLGHHYGPYLLRIIEPDIIVQDIASFLENIFDMPGDISIDCIPVSYDKDQITEKLPPPASEERIKMSYGQKDPKHANDCEYRIVVTLPFSITTPPSSIEVKLNRKLEYIEWEKQ